ncbi:hypothetical protein VII00023_01675 [Vibrio ichthyoenteri ATCC 700023]|uniref:Uncharacterized protein n=1 Tax=Vibrio ichthyoenteri ATCC 700023 TaxID=870968 RepID=F9RWP7_9VIBR|nr:hypothetical protein VII00023_01675 [Vibrio ichthyoenteri ATCC 700023]
MLFALFKQAQGTGDDDAKLALKIEQINDLLLILVEIIFSIANKGYQYVLFGELNPIKHP